MAHMATLASDERAQFAEKGWLLLADAVTPEQLVRLRGDMAGWVDESRDHESAYGTSSDGRPRFDVQPGHTSQRPALRRVQAPSEVSDAYFEVLTDSRIVDAVADLIGPNVRHHHNKINSKQPGSSTEVRCSEDIPHQYHLFRVFDFGRSPRVYILQGSLREVCQLEPVMYRAAI